MKKANIDRVMDMLKILGENEYSLLWDLVEDFQCNGHMISVKNSRQFKQVIIDGVYQHIGGNITIVANDKNYTPLEYVKTILEKEV